MKMNNVGFFITEGILNIIAIIKKKELWWHWPNQPFKIYDLNFNRSSCIFFDHAIKFHWQSTIVIK